jgi:tRNA (guanine6-N2)-methyltransferase
MERLYASTFVAGMGPVTQFALQKALKQVRIERLDDGIVLYRTASTPEQVRLLRFVHNSFAILSFTHILDRADPLKSLVKHIREDEYLEKNILKRGQFGLQVSLESALTKLHPLQREKLEKRLAQVGLRPGTLKSEVELWLLIRREGYGFLGQRLTRHETYDHKLHPGELKPDLAHLLCLLSDPKPADVFLDPCAGHGGIVRERAKAFPYAKILAGDSDLELMKDLRKAAGMFKNFETGRWDVRVLHGIADRSVDAIVTDPPWGSFAKVPDLKGLYADMLKSFARVLKPGGRCVILTGRDGPLDANVPGFARIAQHDILVNGQKARVHVLKAA